MSCCCNDSDPCTITCNNCHEAQTFSLSYNPLNHDFTSLIVNGDNKASIIYDTPVTNTCSEHPFVGVYSVNNASPITNSTTSAEGCVKISNPFSTVSLDNASTAGADQEKSTFLVGSSIESGDVLDVDSNPGLLQQLDFGKGSIGNLSRKLHGTYLIPGSAWHAASGGTHLSKNMETSFHCEYFGTPLSKSRLNTLQATTGPAGTGTAYDVYTPSGINTDSIELCSLEFDPFCDAQLFCLPAKEVTEFATGEKMDNYTLGNTISDQSPRNAVDSDGNTIEMFAEYEKAMGDARVMLGLSVYSDGLGNGDIPLLSDPVEHRYMASTGRLYDFVVDTGATMSDFASGWAVEMTATTTSVSTTGICSYEVYFDLRIQIPTITYDRTFACRMDKTRCQTSFVYLDQGVYSSQAACDWYLDGREPSMTNLPSNLKGTKTNITSSDVPTWSDWVNDHRDTLTPAPRTWDTTTGRWVETFLSDTEHGYWSGFVKHVTGFSVGGDTLPDNAMFSLVEANYTFVSTGDVVTLSAATDYSAATIPSGETWDITSELAFVDAEDGDTLELVFDNPGGDTAEVTNATFDGDVFDTVDKTLETFNPYQRKSITFTTKPSISGTASDTVTITHDQNGNLIASPFTFTLTTEASATSTDDEFAANAMTTGLGPRSGAGTSSTTVTGAIYDASNGQSVKIQSAFSGFTIDEDVLRFDLNTLNLTDGDTYDVYIRSSLANNTGCAVWMQSGTSYDSLYPSNGNHFNNYNHSSGYSSDPPDQDIDVTGYVPASRAGTYTYRLAINDMVYDAVADRYFWLSSGKLGPNAAEFDSIYFRNTAAGPFAMPNIPGDGISFEMGQEIDSEAPRSPQERLRDSQGRKAWLALHTLSPATWEPHKVERWFNTTFQRMIPDYTGCTCRKSFKKIVEALPVDYRSREAFLRWSIDAHNIVNRKLGKPLMDVSEALRMYL